MIAPSLFGFNDSFVSFLSGNSARSKRKGTFMVREEWMGRLAAECQAVAGAFLETDVQQLRSQLQAFIGRLPEPATIFETHVLRLMLFELAVWGAETAHHRYHGVFPGDCRFDATPLLERHWRTRSGDPRAALAGWTDDYASSFEGAHVLPLGAKAVRALEARTHARLDVKELAFELGCSSAELRREFRAWTGIAIGPYHVGLRAKATLEGLLASDRKIDALAEDLGYKSKKNMYRTLKTACGLTPRQIRRLGPEELDELVSRLGGRA
jgi:AraC-like DNA-binding protein